MTGVLAFSICKESGRVAGHVLCGWVERIGDDSGFPCNLISLDILNLVCSYVCYNTTPMYRDHRSYEACASGNTYFRLHEQLVKVHVNDLNILDSLEVIARK